LEALFHEWTNAVAVSIEAAAAVVIALAALEAILSTAGIFVRPRMPQQAKEGVRLRLGRWLSVALEFELAADILRTAVTPSWDDIGKLAAIVVIRSTINYLLQLEIDKVAGRDVERTA
jgi:uncharacterized membrane protein